MRLSTRWTSHLKDAEAKAQFKESLKANKDLFRALKRMLEEDYDRLLQESESSDNYTLPAWGERQADLIGARRQCRKIIKLINFEDK